MDNFMPFDKRVWLAAPYMHGEELDYVRHAYETNWMSTIGENIDETERSVEKLIGCRHAVGLSSGTSALHLCVKLAGIKPGERVFVSDMTFSATANPILYEGGVPVFIDAEYDTWNMCPDALRKAFEKYPDTRVVVTAHLYGTPAKLDEISEICRQNGAILIEDAAESLGSTYKGKQTGSFGSFNTISFNGNKIITGSSGGMLLTDDDEAAAKTKKWSTQSREAAPWYQHEEIGYNYRMSNVIAGVLRGQLLHLDEHIRLKKEIYDRYKEGLKGLPLSLNPYDAVNSEPNHWLSCLLIDRDALCPQSRSAYKAEYTAVPGKSCPTQIFETLQKYNVESRPIWKPLHMQPFFEKYPFFTKEGEWENGAFSVGEDVFARGLCLPSCIPMERETQDKVIRMIASCF